VAWISCSGGENYSPASSYRRDSLLRPLRRTLLHKPAFVRWCLAEEAQTRLRLENTFQTHALAVHCSLQLGYPLDPAQLPKDRVSMVEKGSKRSLMWAGATGRREEKIRNGSQRGPQNECIRRESNPSQLLGRQLSYRWTTEADDGKLLTFAQMRYKRNIRSMLPAHCITRASFREPRSQSQCRNSTHFHGHDSMEFQKAKVHTRLSRGVGVIAICTGRFDHGVSLGKTNTDERRSSPTHPTNEGIAEKKGCR
jgi:hypothetical protein